MLQWNQLYIYSTGSAAQHYFQRFINLDLKKLAYALSQKYKVASKFKIIEKFESNYTLALKVGEKNFKNFYQHSLTAAFKTLFGVRHNEIKSLDLILQSSCHAIPKKIACSEKSGFYRLHRGLDYKNNLTTFHD